MNESLYIHLPDTNWVILVTSFKSQTKRYSKNSDEMLAFEVID